MSKITLQVNVSPGDLNYAAFTVPRLLSAHASSVSERLIIVDATRGQKTRIFDPARRGTARAFAERVDALLELTGHWHSKGDVDRVFVLRDGDPLIEQIRRRWLRNLVAETHDYGGCALMSYFAAFELTRTSYLLHYDADMLLYQKPGFDWAQAAKELLMSRPALIAARPRIAPPAAKEGDPQDAPSLHEVLPLQPSRGGWLNQWFSTRCFLFNREKLMRTLPAISRRESLRLLFRKLIDRGYPPAPELILFRHLNRLGYQCLNLASREAWLLHPRAKPPEFIELLPNLLASVHRGQFPKAQAGSADIDLSAWRALIDEHRLTSDAAATNI